MNIIGGKPQCYDEGIIEKVVDVCENDLKNEGKEWRRLILNEIDRYRYKAMGLNAQEVESLIEIVSEDELVERIDSICGEVFYYATGLDSPVSRW
ncbi:MAG: hypothetical protein KKE11_03245 [Gammaproteobacteria bacterium]|nr:hypothetical protein [Gammaproteobacteria bacterium]